MQEHQTSFTTNVHGREPRKVRAEQKVNRRIAVSLVIGSLILIGVFLPYILYGTHNLAVLYMIHYRLYIPFQVIGAITCIIIFILNITTSATYHLKFLKSTLLSILSVILAFSPFIYSGFSHLIALNSSHVAIAGTSTSYNCISSEERSKNPYLLGTEEPNGLMNHLNAWDAINAYLEAYYRSGQLPESQSDLMPYIQSYETKTAPLISLSTANNPAKPTPTPTTSSLNAVAVIAPAKTLPPSASGIAIPNKTMNCAVRPSRPIVISTIYRTPAPGTASNSTKPSAASLDYR